MLFTGSSKKETRNSSTAGASDTFHSWKNR